jgi:hypothetical protein
VHDTVRSTVRFCFSTDAPQERGQMLAANTTLAQPPKRLDPLPERIRTEQA